MLPANLNLLFREKILYVYCIFLRWMDSLTWLFSFVVWFTFNTNQSNENIQHRISFFLHSISSMDSYHTLLWINYFMKVFRFSLFRFQTVHVIPLDCARSSLHFLTNFLLWKMFETILSSLIYNYGFIKKSDDHFTKIL